ESMVLPSKSTRSAARRRHAEVLAELRRAIVAGRLRPGSRLPTRRDLIRRFGRSALTVQQALDRLAAEGFVTARGRHGTFVADTPPHLRNIALVFPAVATGARFFEAIREAARRVGLRAGLHFPEYWISTDALDRRDHARFLADAAEQRFGAVIFGAPP